MPKTYEGTLDGDRVTWIGEAPPQARPVRVHIIVLDANDDAGRGARMAAALKRLADLNAFSHINDPVEWQREMRKDRSLPGREGHADQ